MAIPPIDVQAIIDLAGIPVVQRTLPDGTRATIGDVAGRRSIILNRKWRFYRRTSDGGRSARSSAPFIEIRRRWFDLSTEGTDVDETVRRLAGEFKVTPPRCGSVSNR